MNYSLSEVFRSKDSAFEYELSLKNSQWRLLTLPPIITTDEPINIWLRSDSCVCILNSPILTDLKAPPLFHHLASHFSSQHDFHNLKSALMQHAQFLLGKICKALSSLMWHKNSVCVPVLSQINWLGMHNNICLEIVKKKNHFYFLWKKKL